MKKVTERSKVKHTYRKHVQTSSDIHGLPLIYIPCFLYNSINPTLCFYGKFLVPSHVKFLSV